MSFKTSLRTATAATPFAHLLGIQAKKATRVEDDKPEEDAEEPEEDDTSAAAPGAETDDDDTTEEDKDGKKGKKAKKAKASDDEECAEEDDEDEDVAKAAKAGRAFERARCEAIFAAPEATGRPHVAAHLAFKTNMSPRAAIDLMSATAVGAIAELSTGRARQARPRVDLGDGGAPAPQALTTAQQIVLAGKKRRGEA
jgi:hypothetical protein